MSSVFRGSIQRSILDSIEEPHRICRIERTQFRVDRANNRVHANGCEPQDSKKRPLVQGYTLHARLRYDH